MGMILCTWPQNFRRLHFANQKPHFCWGNSGKLVGEGRGEARIGEDRRALVCDEFVRVVCGWWRRQLAKEADSTSYSYSVACYYHRIVVALLAHIINRHCHISQRTTFILIRRRLLQLDSLLQLVCMLEVIINLTLQNQPSTSYLFV